MGIAGLITSIMVFIIGFGSGLGNSINFNNFENNTVNSGILYKRQLSLYDVIISILL